MIEPDEQPLDVIAVGAHPDDIEIGCGGTLARLVKLGYRVGIVDLTDGEPTPGSDGPDVRLAEARRAAEVLGIHVREFLNQPNRRLFDSFDVRVALARVFRRHRPQIVIGFGGKTMLASPDHYQAMLITDAAVFYSRLSKWDEWFGGLPPHTITNQINFPLSFQSPELMHSMNCVVADISDTLDQKLEAIRCYATQFSGVKDRALRLVETTNRYYGLIAGYDAGELYLSYRQVGVDDLVDWALRKR